MFHLWIVTPERVFFDSEVQSLIVPGTEGYLGVLTNHAPLITTVKPGKVEFRDAENKTRIIATCGGFFEVANNQARLLVDAAEFADEIDIDRAKAAYERAQQRMAEIQSGKGPEKTTLQLEQEAIERAENRIRIYMETH
ncbi:MAG TPA: ATP synthase F1 subunit epsilon [candidate division Zixibacteria bacterium]|nr:ATP synthase F1 subunit epsilon [candidate division Zixibacteria bacterium]